VENYRFTYKDSEDSDRNSSRIIFENNTSRMIQIPNTYKKLYDLSTNLSFIDTPKIMGEFDERAMAMNYIQPDDVVLEIGANIGRNTLTIARILRDSKQIVALECGADACNKLIQNRNINHLHVNIEHAALSEVPLYQKGWDTLTREGMSRNGVNEAEWAEVSTISYSKLKEKYPFDFNVLVLDCEGAFYNILRDYPEILNGINKILIENDFKSASDQAYVYRILRHNGFRIYASLPSSDANDFVCLWKRG
jgi:FkbM family methyltransferase